MQRSKKTNGVLGGCGFALATTLYSCLLLLLNGGVIAAVYFAIAANGPEVMQSPRLSQLVLFLGPVVLLYIEWAMTDFVSRHSGGKDVREEIEEAT